MNLEETFQGYLNTILKSLKIDNIKNKWSNHWKILCEVADGLLSNKFRNTARNTSENALCLTERMRGLCENYLVINHIKIK